MTNKNEFENLLKELIKRENENKLSRYSPYPFQKEWHNAKGKGTNLPAKQKVLLCANQIGKTYCGCAEDAIHATGLYPDGWDGTVFHRPVKMMISGVSIDKVRDTLQEKLFGDPHNEDEWGTGLIPKDMIVGKPLRKTGYNNSIDTARIRHVSGGISTLQFQGYEQGPRKFMAQGIDVQHADEEPPPEIYSQLVRSTIATKGIINLTFTPEHGVTQVVDSFLNELGPGQALVTASWDDAPHIANDPVHREQLLAALPPHEREMRSKGVPTMGSGLIFPISDEQIRVTPFDIPNHWPRLCGMDLGGQEHPFAAAWVAWDRDNDVKYIYREYKNRGILGVHAEALREGEGQWVPIAWPHDAGRKDRQSGKPIAEILRTKYRLNMLPNVFSNPPAVGQKEGQGGQGVEVGLYTMYDAMESGSLKVFSTCSEWFREKNLYHRKEGKVVDRLDDLMAASRYAFQSMRFADLKVRKKRRKVIPFKGASNW